MRSYFKFAIGLSKLSTIRSLSSRNLVKMSSANNLNPIELSNPRWNEMWTAGISPVTHFPYHLDYHSLTF